MATYSTNKLHSVFMCTWKVSVKAALLCSQTQHFGFPLLIWWEQYQSSPLIKKEMSQDTASSMQIEQYLHCSPRQICIYSVSVSLFSCVFNHQGYFLGRRGSLSSCKAPHQYCWLLSMQTRGKEEKLCRPKVLMRLSPRRSVIYIQTGEAPDLVRFMTIIWPTQQWTHWM